MSRNKQSSIDNEFVPYEQAVALKELGFDEPCFGYRDGSGSLMIREMHHCVISTPTFAQAFRFFRQQFDWQHSIEPTADQHSHDLGYNYWIWNYRTGEEHYTMPKNRPTGDWEFVTYEEAELECLKHLIQLNKITRSKQEEIEQAAKERFSYDVAFDGEDPRITEHLRDAFIEGAKWESENICKELQIRVQVIKSEPDGIVRETMINNLLLDL